MEKKITYSSLSWPLKTAVVFAWIVGLFYLMTFVIGFIIGVMGAL